MFKVDELPEEESLVDEASWPLEVQNLDALADAEIAAVGQEEG